jgi:hypothetical protein
MSSMTSDGFRKLALTLPESRESSHQDHPDFRVGKRVFATLAYPDPSWAMVKLTPSQQAHFATLHPKIFVPVKGGWGARGATNVKLKAANRAAVWPALVQAWRNASD